MPYIKQENRFGEEEMMYLLDDVNSDGDLNYLITSIIDAYLRHRGLKYDSINSAIGVLECAKLELYRRIAGPYEDKKIVENGDVYTVQK
jgi:hypothetical protein